MSYHLFESGEIVYSHAGMPRTVARRRFVVFCDPHAARSPIAVVTERLEDEGMSITNAAEEVRDALIDRLATASFRLVEHYENGIRGETFDWVYFDDHGRPFWRPLEVGDRSRDALVRLLDGDAELADTALPQHAREGS